MLTVSPVRLFFSARETNFYVRSGQSSVLRNPMSGTVAEPGCEERGGC